MRAILIPVKNFAESKTRLAPHYSSRASAELAAALCKDFFAVVAQARGFDRVFVVSQEKQALAWAEERGWDTIIERAQISESHSVDSALCVCAAQGIDTLLRLPIDIPLATPGDIELVLAAAEGAPCAVMVPSRDGTGTNALLRSPPALFPSHFGADSFAVHLSEGERRGVRVNVLHNSNIALDVDDADDLRLVVDRLRTESATARWVERHALSE